tara:strand:- start:119 stop:970 length:852 start_codon:yes stop_codon:yes gene_type:complete
MNSLTNWIGSVICRIRNIKVIYWGHGFYGNEKFLKLFFRKLFYSFADIHLVYSNRSRKLFSKNNFDISGVHVIYNSIKSISDTKLIHRKISKNYQYEMFNKRNLPVLVFIGRLTKQKKINLLIDCINEINLKKTKINLLIIGDGPERKFLENISLKGIEKKEIYFYGSEYDESTLFNLLSNAKLCVSPGEIGLTAIHCLSYGLPVASHDDISNQMPEVEVIKEGVNGFLFKNESKKDLKEKIIKWILKYDKLKVKESCYKSVLKYSPNNQFNIFENVINKYKL